MNELSHDTLDNEHNWWTIAATIWDDERISLRILSGGIVQDVYPPEVATAALKKWNDWMQQI